MICSVVKHLKSGRENTRLPLVFPLHFFRSLYPLPACFKTENITGEASIFVKLNGNRTWNKWARVNLSVLISKLREKNHAISY